MKISFVILTWNRYKFLEKCLLQLVESIEDKESCEVVVMDNGSTDKTRDILKSYEQNSLVRVILREKNYGLNSYKKLFKEAKGEYVVVVDDDVLTFPKGLDQIFLDYMQAYPDYGFVALNVVQNEFTNGAKPGVEHYAEDSRGEKTIEEGPTGGWCTCFRKKDYNKISWRFYFTNFNMKRGEDGMISRLFKDKLGLRSGIIKDYRCFHASGPHYAKEYGHLDREIEKYSQSGLGEFVEWYKKYE